ncbi:NlpC/P60 family protein [Peptoniphilus vaginalis]|uniref:NlpC/P60 family protein n=1 Tax=Peptoniphilus vaginalis TaxID=1756987 RepID=UPI0023F6869F|nr:NlpC/P60 family protein [Peptoniphilus vaginalis]
MLDKNKVEKFIAAAMVYEGDLYSQPRRMDKGYSDCSSIPYKALRDTGMLDESQTKRTISTKFMRDGDPRMYQIPMAKLERGDLLWWQKPGIDYYYGHTGIYLGNGKVLEAIKPRAKVTSIKRLPWQRAYRIKSLESSGKVTPPAKPKVEPKVGPYVPIIVRGKTVKAAILIDNVSYITVKGANVSVRDFFETLGMTVTWKDRKIYVD